MRPPVNVHPVELRFAQLPLRGFHRGAGKSPIPLIDTG